MPLSCTICLLLNQESLTYNFEDESAVEETQIHLIDKVGLLEGPLFELDREHAVGVKVEIRNTISSLQADLESDEERSIAAALIQIEKFKEARREMDRKLISQIEEQRIRNDVELEEAKKRERALQEERVLQERVKAEAEAAKKRAVEVQKAELEAQRRATKEAAEREATETRKVLADQVVQKEDTDLRIDANGETLQELKNKGNVVKGAESALKAEAARLQKYKELDEKNQALRLTSNMDYHSYELQIGRQIRQIIGSEENVRIRVDELIKLFSDPRCPQSVSVGVFAKKVVSHSGKLVEVADTAFARGRVIALVTKHVPFVMDIVLAEFHRACIYTVPYHVHYSELAFRRKEEGGKIESAKQYLEGIECYMKLYGALLQTEVDGAQNMLKEGWAWFARFLNVLPSNKYTAVALYRFLLMAGFAPYKKYGYQFQKILNVIHGQFLDALKSSRDPMVPVIRKIRTYIETKQFLQEPKGWRLQISLLSDIVR
ncbi:protein GLE1-like isoform X2 [Macadamia integrifolia]|uniref:protein GLE1-like isoform X2 n=1 Tax=Macadamia integrifolia TaxID=60698 RepID=UPI001C4FEEB8|nr:protein GLE1-like isoform X2 [Macadamia integrifolia]